MNDFTQRYDIKFKQEDVGFVKPWRITDFIEKITTLHYKKELKNEIVSKLNKGVKPENIVLFKKSFNIHLNYSNINDGHSLLTQRGAKLTYHLGNFISFYPNKKVKLVSTLFDLFSDSYTLLNRSQIRLYKDRIHVYIAEILQSSNDNLNLVSFRSDLNSRLTELSDDDQKEVSTKINEMIRKANQSYTKFQREVVEFNSLEDNTSQQDMQERLKNKKYRKLFEELILQFYNKFNDLQRPIVGILNDKTKTIEILAVNFIKKKSNDNSQIDLKSVTHNSPYEIFISAGSTVVMMLYQMYCNVTDRKSLMKASINVEDDLEETETLDEYLEFEEDVEVFDEEKWYVNLNKISTIVDNDHIQIYKLDENTNSDDGVSYILSGIDRKLDDSLRRNFEENNFISGDIELKANEKAV